MSLLWPICAIFHAEIPLPPQHANGIYVYSDSGGWNGAAKSKLSFIFVALQGNLFGIDSRLVSPILQKPVFTASLKNSNHLEDLCHAAAALKYDK